MQQSPIDDGTNSATATWSGGSAEIADGNWHQVGITYDATSNEIKLWFDGEEVASATNTSLGSVSGGASYRFAIGGSAENGAAWDGTNSAITLVRVARTDGKLNAGMIRFMYEHERRMFEASAKCLLQSTTTDAVLDVAIDPITGKVAVTQTDDAVIFDGLVIDSEPAILGAASGTAWEHFALWDGGKVTITDQEIVVEATTGDVRGLWEMLRGLRSELPAGVDLSKAKAQVLYDQAVPSITDSVNVKSVTDDATGQFTVHLAVPFKTLPGVLGTNGRNGDGITNWDGNTSGWCSAPGSLDTSLSHAAGLIEIAACHA